MARSSRLPVHEAKPGSEDGGSRVRRALASIRRARSAQVTARLATIHPRWAWPEASWSQMQAGRSPMKAIELVRRLRAYRTFSSPLCFEHPPPPSLPLGTDTADFPYDRRQVTSQFPDVLES